MDPLYLVDGSGYIFRAYYAIAPLTSESGLPTNALLGFTRMLIKLLKDVSARHIAMAFDVGAPTFRHQMYEGYKANRGECPEDLVPQMPYFRKVADVLGIACLEKEGFEADDVLASVARRLASDKQRLVIVSGDKDLLQLVGPNISVWDAMRDLRYDSDLVKEKFGVLPEQVEDYLALTGDSSDNIPGVSGIGPKTASSLLQALGSIDRILENPEKIEEIKGLRGKAGVRRKIESAGETLRLSRELVKLDVGVEPFCKVESVEEYAWKGPDEVRVKELFTELSFASMMKDIPLPDGGKLNVDTNDSLERQKDYHLVTKESFNDFLRQLKAQGSFAFDTETSSLDVLTCTLLGISISWCDDEAWYLPLYSEVNPDLVLDPETVRDELNPIFSDPEVAKYGLNLKFDIGVIEENGYKVAGTLFDDMLASHILHPDRRRNGLKYLSRTMLKEPMASYEEVLGEAGSLAEVPLERVSRYACQDADASWKLKTELYNLLGPASDKPETSSLLRAFEEVEMPLVPVLSSMERSGIKVDIPFLSSLKERYEGELAILEARICELAGCQFNLNSPKQLAEVLFEGLGIPTKGIRKTKTGFSTDANVLNKLAPDYPIIAEILDYRELFKLKTTYVDSLINLVHPRTGRVHTSFNQAIAATGRLSSSEPNLQNIPIRTERGRKLRRAFIADEGKVLISADYSQIELRVLAHLSEDENLIRAFSEGEDIHTATARELFGGMFGEVDKEMRRAAKTINFGLIYGMSAFRLARQLAVSQKQAREYIENYFGRYPGVKQYFDRVVKGAESLGYAETLFGRRRYLKEIETAGRDAGYARRSLINAPVQGTAAEIVKIAMIKLYETFSRLSSRPRMVLQVHDELVIEVEKAEGKAIESVVVSEMESAVKLSVPLKVESRVCESWGDS